jgi:hypothetical protein
VRDASYMMILVVKGFVVLVYIERSLCKTAATGYTVHFCNDPTMGIAEECALAQTNRKGTEDGRSGIGPNRRDVPDSWPKVLE